MNLRSYFPAFLKTLLAVAFIVAGGSFSHSFADRSHHHAQEAVAAGGHSHDHMSSDIGHLMADYETVHCGAYLLALTTEDLLRIPDFLDEALPISFAAALSRVGTIDTPPPRPVSLSL